MVRSQHALGGPFNPNRKQPSLRLRAHLLQRRTPSASSVLDDAPHYVFRGITESPRCPIHSSSSCPGVAGMNKIPRTLELGASDYIVKPFTPTELVGEIKALAAQKTNHG